MVNNRNFILPPLIPKTKLMKMIKKERQFSALVEHIKKYEKNKIKISTCELENNFCDFVCVKYCIYRRNRGGGT